MFNLSLPEGYCEVHKVSGLITNGDNSWLWVYYSAIVILHLAHAVDDVPLRNIFAVRANDINLKINKFHENLLKF